MQKVSFQIPLEVNHAFVDYSEGSEPKYYADEDLKTPILDFSNPDCVETLLPNKLSKIEFRDVDELVYQDDVATCINKLSLWPYAHMVDAEVIIDGNHYFSYSLLNNKLKSKYREEMENSTWKHSLLISYRKNDGNKIGFLIVRG